MIPDRGVCYEYETTYFCRRGRIQIYTLANRWRVEPKDVEAYKRGELVEPVKPIVFYVDDAFPAMWKEPVRKAALRWNVAFEKIGLKNVIQVRISRRMIRLLIRII
ncbi:MAG: hypothetical protein ACLU4N_11220 [Butyricimonas faecihominis]